jgi:hypothetical protein
MKETMQRDGEENQDAERCEVIEGQVVGQRNADGWWGERRVGSPTALLRILLTKQVYCNSRTLCPQAFRLQIWYIEILRRPGSKVPNAASMPRPSVPKTPSRFSSLPSLGTIVSHQCVADN